MKVLSGLRPGELVFCVVLLLLSATAFWQSYAIEGFQSLSGPGFFPMAATCVMTICAGLILKDAMAARYQAQPPETSAIGYLFPPRFLVIVPMMVAFAALMPQVGFFLAAAAFIFAAILFLWRKNLLLSIAITLLSIGVIYVIFRILFSVVLPTGRLWQ